jgi:hypothetical protein
LSEEDDRKGAAPACDRGGDYLEVTRAFWQTRTNRLLSREDAREMAHNLLGFFTVLREWTLAERRRANRDAKGTPSSQLATRQCSPTAKHNPNSR